VAKIATTSSKEEEEEEEEECAGKSNDRLRREATVLSQLSGVLGVPTLIALANWRDSCVLLTQGSGVSSLALLRQRRKGFSLQELEPIARDVVQTLQGMHTCGYAHMDVSPGNIVWCSGRWGLIDFASSVRLGEPVPLDLPVTQLFASDRLRFRIPFVANSQDDFTALAWSLVYLHEPERCTIRMQAQPDERFAELRDSIASMVSRLMHRERRSKQE
jgi:serine/threonine protein kinase